MLHPCMEVFLLTVHNLERNIATLTTLNSAGERLKQIRTLSRLSRSQIFNKYGVSASTLKHWENSIELSDSNLSKCVDIYREEGILFSREWVTSGTGLAPKSFTEIAKNLNHSHQANPTNENELLLLEEVKFFRDLYQDGTVMIVPNNDMLPYYKGGDYVCGRWIFSDQILKAVNQDCIIQLVNGGKYFRRLVKDNNGFYNIACLNPLETKSEPVFYNVQIESVAPIMWHRKILT